MININTSLHQAELLPRGCWLMLPVIRPDVRGIGLPQIALICLREQTQKKRGRLNLMPQLLFCL